ncbi:MAG: GntR family transcriptional regulator [Verrucomicrobia bacterium]|nr:GntR family transcriptional regulator [Verrucomicrobiota bacterium]
MKREFLRSRADQLADYLRGCIARGELVEPLPGIREWSSRLSVGHTTLEAALKTLEQEGLVAVRTREGVHLNFEQAAPNPPQTFRVVRWLYCGRGRNHDISPCIEVFRALSDRLGQHDIRLSIENCGVEGIHAIHERGESRRQMVLLGSLPLKLEKLFMDFRRSALVIGIPAPGTGLPYVSNDAFSAIRHATHWLAGRGCLRVTMFIGVKRQMTFAEKIFYRACSESPQPVRGEVACIPLELDEQAQAARKFAARVKGKQGVIAIYPSSVSTLMTALMKQGVDVPGQVEFVAVNTTLQGVRVVPRPAYYPFPMDTFTKVVCRAAIQYFERGRLPRLRKMIPLKMAPPAE